MAVRWAWSPHWRRSQRGVSPSAPASPTAPVTALRRRLRKEGGGMRLEMPGLTSRFLFWLREGSSAVDRRRPAVLVPPATGE